MLPRSDVSDLVRFSLGGMVSPLVNFPWWPDYVCRICAIVKPESLPGHAFPVATTF